MRKMFVDRFSVRTDRDDRRVHAQVDADRARTQMAPRTSVLEMMSSATELPVAPTPDAF